MAASTLTLFPPISKTWKSPTLSMEFISALSCAKLAVSFDSISFRQACSGMCEGEAALPVLGRCHAIALARCDQGCAHRSGFRQALDCGRWAVERALRHKRATRDRVMKDKSFFERARLLLCYLSTLSVADCSQREHPVPWRRATGDHHIAGAGNMVRIGASQLTAACAIN